MPGITIEQAIAMVKEEYEKNKDKPYIFKPVAYALYQVWKKADRQEVGRKFEKH